MKPFAIDQLPMWLSFAATVAGIVFSILLARLAHGGALFVFTLLLTAAAATFGFHHAIELLGVGMSTTSEALEAVSSFIFLAAAIYLGYRLRKIIYGR